MANADVACFERHRYGIVSLPRSGGCRSGRFVVRQLVISNLLNEVPLAKRGSIGSVPLIMSSGQTIIAISNKSRLIHVCGVIDT